MPDSVETKANLYCALLLFETHNLMSDEILYSEEFHFLSSSTLEEAQAAVLARAQQQETHYQNGAGETLSVKLWRVLDVQAALYENAADGPLYVRHFHNIEAYQAFEPLLDQKEERADALQCLSQVTASPSR
ncbi:DUF4288 domain-containing protein [Deinococcus psychrotolerans]|uniref:DUF4288 domain-containing protein n=1 Tax=Deinococcus psychrotolerans TaxID=2489213 RepID=A0A3G8YAJ1_9DEIO|nr:DUF4288 domain-containing protein [Deinococcus psychrotolerans]AZI41920.1 DUF4288 domain-containing protein [Deinococcus psychrotolerans]